MSRLWKVLFVVGPVVVVVVVVVAGLVWFVASSGRLPTTGAALDGWDAVGPPVATVDVIAREDVILDVVWGDDQSIGLHEGLYLVNAKDGAMAQWSAKLEHRAFGPVAWSPAIKKLFWQTDDHAVMRTDPEGKSERALPKGEWGVVAADGVHVLRGPDPALMTMGSDSLPVPLAGRVKDAWIQNTALSSTADRLAFVRERTIEVARPDGSDDVVLLEVSNDVFSLKWSPSGDAVAALLRSKDYQKKELWILGTDGTSKQIDIPMPPRSALDSHFAGDPRVGVGDATWSPDGTKLALLVDRNGPCWSGGQDLGPSGCFNSIYIVNRDGTGLRRLSMRHQAQGQLLWLR